MEVFLAALNILIGLGLLIGIGVILPDWIAKVPYFGVAKFLALAPIYLIYWLLIAHMAPDSWVSVLVPLMATFTGVYCAFEAGIAWHKRRMVLVPRSAIEQLEKEGHHDIVAVLRKYDNQAPKPDGKTDSTTEDNTT